jgi:pimeloyl-ACP methyl ester carboxylesterase
MRASYAHTLDGIRFFTGGWPLADHLPSLIFIHGSGGAAALWQHQIDAFEGLANTVALDLPGHGGSAGPGLTDVPGYAARVAAFIRQLAPPWPIPCGLSIGGAIVLQLLLDEADVAAAGVLVNTGARLRVAPAIFDAIEKDYDGFVEMMATLGAAGTTDPRRLAPLMAETRACPPAVTAGDFKACDDFDVMDRLTEIKRPVLVLSADADQLTPPKYADYLEAHITGARRGRVAAAGHLSPLEQPGAVNAAIAAFVGGCGFGARV